jgi:hypothetical protein
VGRRHALCGSDRQPDALARLGPGEFELAAAELGWSLADAVARVRTAVDAAFCEPERARSLHRALDEFVAGLDE